MLVPRAVRRLRPRHRASPSAERRVRRIAGALSIPVLMTVLLGAYAGLPPHPADQAAGSEFRAAGRTAFRDVPQEVPDRPLKGASASPEGWRLVWSDEFSGAAIDRARWEVRHLSTFGDGNQELACLMNRPENARVERGLLVITALREKTPIQCGSRDSRFPGGRSYTSAFLETRGKADFRFGRFEVRARLPVTPGESAGMWPAFWMRPADLSVGELDVLEALGTGPDGAGDRNRVVQTIHYDYLGTHPAESSTYVLPEGELSNEFHTFAVEWEPGTVRWYVDEVLTFERTAHTTPWLDSALNGRFFLRLNLAVGGTWAGAPDDATRFPAELLVNYVRVYSR